MCGKSPNRMGLSYYSEYSGRELQIEPFIFVFFIYCVCNNLFFVLTIPRITSFVDFSEFWISLNRKFWIKEADLHWNFPTGPHKISELYELYENSRDRIIFLSLKGFWHTIWTTLPFAIMHIHFPCIFLIISRQCQKLCSKLSLTIYIPLRRRCLGSIWAQTRFWG